MTDRLRHTITRRFEWDMGHRVTNHASKCQNLHGHRYVALVTLSADLVDTHGASDEGMVQDFAEVKERLGAWIDAEWDHGFMVWERDPLASMLHATDTKVMVVPFVPTAENIAGELLRVASDLLGPVVERVVVYETPNCTASAEYV